MAGMRTLVGLRLLPGRLVGRIRPNRVRHPTDWSTTSDCSPRRLAAAQLSSVSGRRAYAWRGLAPLWMCALGGAPGGARRWRVPGRSQGAGTERPALGLARDSGSWAAASRHFGQRGLDMVNRREFGAGEGGRDQGVVREQVDLARQTGGRLKERFFGGGFEERELRAGESQPMRQIAGELVAGERGHVVADDDALGERLMDGHGEAAAQFGVAEQQE